MIRYLDDFSLSVFGPEGLRWRGAADGNKAGWLSVQSGSDQLTASCTHTHGLQTVGLNGGMVTNPWPWDECSAAAFMLTEELHGRSPPLQIMSPHNDHRNYYYYY